MFLIIFLNVVNQVGLLIIKRLYKDFEAQKYESVIAETDDYITRFDGEDIVPKYEFLKAVSKARLYGFDSYKEALNFIALNYRQHHLI